VVYASQEYAMGFEGAASVPESASTPIVMLAEGVDFVEEEPTEEEQGDSLIALDESIDEPIAESSSQSITATTSKGIVFVPIEPELDGLKVLNQYWQGNTFYLTLDKKSAISKAGDLSLNFVITNPTKDVWALTPADKFTKTIGDGVINTQFSAPNGSPNSLFNSKYNITAADYIYADSNGRLTLNFKGKIDPSVTDALEFYLPYYYTENAQNHENNIVFKIIFTSDIAPNFNWTL
jgi:hypothetical protein